jgi:predicted secreted hydrolase
VRRYWLVVVLVLLAAVLAFLLWPRPPSAPASEGFSLQGLLGGDASGYARAASPRPFQFPADHGPHPDYRSEWWYLTGNLRSADGRRFGFQFTVFRSALSPAERGGESAWATRQAYMGHFAVTDVEGGTIYGFERFSRGATGLAGAQAQPFRVWLEDWQLAGDDGFPWTLHAAEDDVGLTLRVVPRKPLVLQGDQGLSQKGPEPGNASYYYSYTRLAAEGELRLGDRRFEVEGTAWLDREWSTSALSPDLAGWDWFALQLDDGSDLMLYRLRSRQGEASPFSAATYVPPSGTPVHLGADDFRVEPVAYWISPETGTRYPVQWRLQIPSLAIDLNVAAAVADQELDLAVRYWEGAVDVSGHLGDRRTKGVGYMELTGYGAGDAARAR